MPRTTRYTCRQNHTHQFVFYNEPDPDGDRWTFTVDGRYDRDGAYETFDAANRGAQRAVAVNCS